MSFLYSKHVEDRKEEKSAKSYINPFVSRAYCYPLSFLCFGRNMAALIKGGPLSSIYKWFILRKPKHNNDYLKVTVHYNKHIPFLIVHNLKPYTLDHMCRR